jgi:hypothetical protein
MLFKIPGISRSFPEMIGKKRGLESLWTGASEGLQEMNTGAFESEAQRHADLASGKIMDDGSTAFERGLQHYSSYEGITEGLLGAIGGVGMQVMSNLTYLGANKRARAFKSAHETDLGNFMTADKVDMNNFVSSLFESAGRGTYGTTLSVLDAIRNTPQEEATAKNYRHDYKERANLYHDIATEFESEYNATMHKYSEKPDEGMALVNSRTNRDVNRKLALKAQQDIVNLKSQYTTVEEEHPLFPLKQSILELNATKAELDNIDTQIEDLSIANAIDRTYDTNETLEDLDNRKSLTLRKYESIEYKLYRKQQEYLNNRKLDGVAEDKTLAEMEEYFKNVNEVDNKLKVAYRAFGEASSVSNIASAQVNKFESSPKELKDYVERNKLAYKKTIEEFTTKLNNTKTREQFNQLKLEYTNEQFIPFLARKEKEITKAEEKERIRKEKESKKKPVVTPEEVSGEPIDDIDGADQSSSSSFSSGTPEDQNQVNTTVIKPSEKLVSFDSILNKPADQLTDNDLGFLFNGKTEDTDNPGKTITLHDLAKRQIDTSTIDDIDETVKSTRQFLNLPALQHSQIKDYFADLLPHALELRDKLKLEDKTKQDIIDKEDVVTEPIIEDENTNLEDAVLRTVVSEKEGPTENEPFKRLKLEAATALAFLDTAYLENEKGEKKTAANEKAATFNLEIASPVYFKPKSKIRFILDINSAFYKGREDNIEEVPIAIEYQSKSGWKFAAHLHTLSWINPKNVTDTEKGGNIEKQRVALMEIRNYLYKELQNGNTVETTIKSKGGGEKQYNIKITDGKVEVNSKGNPIIARLPLIECRPGNTTLNIVKDGALYIGEQTVNSEFSNKEIDLSGNTGLVFESVKDNAGNEQLLPLYIQRGFENTQILDSILTVIKAFYNNDTNLIDKINVAYEQLGSNRKIELSNAESLKTYLSDYLNLSDFLLTQDSPHNSIRIGIDKKGGLVFGKESDGYKFRITNANDFNKTELGNTTNEQYLIKYLKEKMFSIKLSKINNKNKVFSVLVNKTGDITSTTYPNYNSFTKTFTESYFNGRNQIPSTGEYIYFMNPNIQFNTNFIPGKTFTESGKEYKIKIKEDIIESTTPTGRDMTEEELAKFIKSREQYISELEEILKYGTTYREAIEKLVDLYTEETDRAYKIVVNEAKEQGITQVSIERSNEIYTRAHDIQRIINNINKVNGEGTFDNKIQDDIDGWKDDIINPPKKRIIPKEVKPIIDETEDDIPNRPFGDPDKTSNIVLPTPSQNQNNLVNKSSYIKEINNILDNLKNNKGKTFVIDEEDGEDIRFSHTETKDRTEKRFVGGFEDYQELDVIDIREGDYYIHTYRGDERTITEGEAINLIKRVVPDIDIINLNLSKSIIDKAYTIEEFNSLPKEEQDYLIKCWS